MAIRRTFSSATALVAVLAPVLIATGCGSNDSTAEQAASLTVADQWVKAADNGMTAAFGVLKNSSDTEIRVVSASSPTAEKAELHEIVPGAGSAVMREKKDGYAIGAKSSVELKAGADHIMLMGLTQPIKAGDTVSFELRLADGSVKKVDAIARDFSGNQEDYHQ
ncbi:MAG: copper chaperone PCu(A)C [Gordonia sp. (in: high G+C Gram-positive bacteria)]|uniref:copper chaperone PCu(A)C n=1 Tax=Gordonia sp. (in: high G+C Gram-positive bacteria) TaxID=84139 RepID=UPI0039E33C51